LTKYKDFDCTIWENGIIILTERLLPKKGEDIEVRQGKIYKGTIEELSANYKKELFQEG